MKKRIILIVSSIIAILVVTALVIFTIASKPKGDDVNVPNDNGNNSSITQPDDNFGGDTADDIEYNKYNKHLYYLVGDTVDSEYFVNNYEKIGESFPFITKNENGTFTATSEGKASATIILNDNQITLHINVYNEGNGTKDNPFVIVRIEDLVNHFNKKNSGVYYVQKAPLDLSSYNGGNWTPLGSLSYPFMSHYDGNGFKINNMKITVDTSNFKNYISTSGSSKSMLLGFFGVVAGTSTQKTEIKNLILNNASIDTSKIDTKAFKSKEEFKSINSMSSVALLAGYIENVTLDGIRVNGKIVSSLNASSTYGIFDSPVAGLVGVAMDSEITATNVQANIDATGVGFMDGEKVLSSSVAGFIGRAGRNVTVENCIVCPTIKVSDDEQSVVAGAIGVVGGAGNSCKITNVSVVSVKNANSVKNAKLTAVLKKGKEVNIAGFVSTVNKGNEITNCYVNDITINSEDLGTKIVNICATGFVTTNYGTITNSAVENANISANIATGFVLFNHSDINYNEEFDKQYIANVSLKTIYQAGGFAYSNFGRIYYASETEDRNVDMYAEIYCARLSNLKEEKVLSKTDSYMVSGFVVYAEEYSTISNINVMVNLYDTINASGMIGFAVGSTNVFNCNVSSTIRTLPEVEGKAYSAKSYIASGVVGIINKTGKLDLRNTSVAITVNNANTSNENEKYSLGVFGSLIAISEGGKGSVKLSKVTVSSVKVNFDVKTDISTVKNYTIGSVAGFGKTNQFSISKGDLTMKTYGKINIAGQETDLRSFSYMN